MQAVYVWRCAHNSYLTFFFEFSRDFGDRLYFYHERWAEPGRRAAALGPGPTAPLLSAGPVCPQDATPLPPPRLPEPVSRGAVPRVGAFKAEPHCDPTNELQTCAAAAVRSPPMKVASEDHACLHFQGPGRTWWLLAKSDQRDSATSSRHSL